VATQANYFEHLTPEGFSQGQAFEGSGQLVMGARVATKLGYSLGQSMSVAHGQAQALGDQHDQLTFELVGILKPTGGPIDNAVLIDIADFHKLHIDPLRPAPPAAANAALVGVTAPFALFQLQRKISAEPDLTATLPGVALSRLWAVFGGAERALEILSLALLVCAGLTLLAQTMGQVERRTREMALYRAMGAPLRFSLGLPIVESALIGLVSWSVAWCLLLAASTLISDWLQQSQGILLPQTGVTGFESTLLIASAIAPVVLSALPHWLAWRRSQLKSLERL
jgi:putative ABC transport system permease protein